MTENIDEITITYEEDGQVVVEELDKEILTRGAWTTILFRYRQFDNKLNDFGPEKYMIRRYRKMNGQFRPQTKFNISNPRQARQIVDILSKWLEESDEQVK
jgi:hypothetical protein